MSNSWLQTKERLSTSFLPDNEPDIVGIECIFLLTLIDNALSFKIFSLTNTRFLDLEGFTDILAEIRLWLHNSPELESFAERES